VPNREPDVEDWPGFHGRVVYDDVADGDAPLLTPDKLLTS